MPAAKSCGEESKFEQWRSPRDQDSYPVDIFVSTGFHNYGEVIKFAFRLHQ